MTGTFFVENLDDYLMDLQNRKLHRTPGCLAFKTIFCGALFVLNRSSDHVNMGDMDMCKSRPRQVADDIPRN